MKATKILATLSALAIVLAACSSTPAATAPATTAPTAAAATLAPTPAPTVAPTPAPTVAAVVYKAELKSTNEVPPVQGSEASCSGNATITVSGAQAKIDITLTGCPGTLAINVAHVMEAASTATGPVRVDTTIKAGEFTLTGGGGTVSRTVPIDPAVAARMAATPGQFYFNIHTVANPGGVVRGQLVKQ